MWAQYMSNQIDDRALLRRNFADSAAAAAIVYFPIFLADAAEYGDSMLNRLSIVVDSFLESNTHVVLLLGRPDYYAPGCVSCTHDVIRDSGPRAYFFRMIQRTLSFKNIRLQVVGVSVYWLGLSWICTGQGIKRTRRGPLHQPSMPLL